MNMPDPIPARLAALKTTPTPDLKKQWRDLFDSEPPPFNRRYLESRIAYRIQELAYGGLKPETIRRLERLGEELDGGDKTKRGIRADRERLALTAGAEVAVAGRRLLQLLEIHRIRRLGTGGDVGDLALAAGAAVALPGGVWA